MEDNRIQNQIAIYMTNKKLCEFTDKLKPAPIEYYAHMHAQGEEQADGIRAYSCIGVVLQDYSNGLATRPFVSQRISPLDFSPSFSAECRTIWIASTSRRIRSSVSRTSMG